MWAVIHWFFMYWLNPNPAMHLIASMFLSAGAHRLHHKLSRRDFLPACGLFLVYAGFYFNPLLDHFAFQPWWVVSIIGLRQREFLILVGGIMTGVYLLLSSRTAIFAHVCMNLGSMLRVRKISFKTRALVHVICTIIYVQEPNFFTLTYKDFLLGASAAMCACIHTRPDWFSLSTVFASPIALGTFFLHALDPNWYHYYKNNHFYRVKNTFYFMYPIAIVCLASVWNLSAMPHLPS